MPTSLFLAAYPLSAFTFSVSNLHTVGFTGRNLTRVCMVETVKPDLRRAAGAHLSSTSKNLRCVARRPSFYIDPFRRNFARILQTVCNPLSGRR